MKTVNFEFFGKNGQYKINSYKHDVWSLLRINIITKGQYNLPFENSINAQSVVLLWKFSNS